MTKLPATARAAVFPLQWDEPGSTAVVEAMPWAPRGCLPELVEAGRTEPLADSEDELAAQLELVDRLDSATPQDHRAEFSTAERRE